jgi:hypothetical protein
VGEQHHCAENWKREPEQHDFPAAVDYLGLLFPATVAAALVDDLQAAQIALRKAKDIMRASCLPLLPSSDPLVAADLRRVAHGSKLSPVLLIRGNAQTGRPLIIADGYHRVCASYHIGDDAAIPCLIADLPGDS